MIRRPPACLWIAILLLFFFARAIAYPVSMERSLEWTLADADCVVPPEEPVYRTL